MDPVKITELANLLRQNGDKLLNSESAFTLSGPMLRALNDSFTLIADSFEGADVQNFQVVKPINHKSPVFRDLQLIYDFVQKTTMLCIKHYPTEEYFDGQIDISKFRALRHLEVQKTKVKQIIGIQPLRSQMQQLTCIRSLESVDEIITSCGGDNSNGFVWNELKKADFSYNNLKSVDTSLEFAQYLQYLNLRHNQLSSVEAIKWLPHLKTLDLSFNCLQFIPKFHVEAYKRLQSLNMNNNYVEDLNGIAKMEAITDLDLSDNCLLDHSCLLPISALLTLKFLNLFGNPLSCHPKHRLVTAQFLNKNCSTVRFVLDFAELTKYEKAITGRYQLRQVGSLQQFMPRPSSTSISLNSETFGSHTTPASSVGSVRSFKLQGSFEPEKPKAVNESISKKRSSKMRTVEIEDAEVEKAAENVISVDNDTSTNSNTERDSMTKSLILETNQAHLKTKEQIETLREKYGSEWLQYGNAEKLKSVIGIESTSVPKSIIEGPMQSRQLFNDFLGEFSSNSSAYETAESSNLLARTSTPTNENEIHNKYPLKDDNSTLYMSSDKISNSTKSQLTLYKSAFDNVADDAQQIMSESQTELSDQTSVVDDEPEYLKNSYQVEEDEESEISETENDEETYIVYTSEQHDPLFLTISSNFIREKDTVTQRTKTKWSLKILESCDRVKSNMLRINFDTVKKDKQERIYTAEDDLCQELEKLLRDVLSKRDLAEMNQTIYRCVNCTCQFSHEHKNAISNCDVICPDCKSVYVAEVHDIPNTRKSSSATGGELSLSPAAIVEESPIRTPFVVESTRKMVDNIEETNSIGSVNSLNESSSCSKISNSQSSFDSNQSVVGSTNTERDLEMNCESDVDILSNPSQSSIEVLDHMLHTVRQTSSEERRVSQMPHLETITDQSYKNDDFPDNAQLLNFLRANTETMKLKPSSTETLTPTANPMTNSGVIGVMATAGPLAHFNLTESSSSGSITDSICTTYEQQQKVATVTDDGKTNEKSLINNLLAAETGRKENIITDQPSETALKRNESGLSNMLGALFQSTNVLMSSSKKLIDVETGIKIEKDIITSKNKTSSMPNIPTACRPYKFNYNDFNDIDHRLKLYFYQKKFDEEDERFMWLVRGSFYNTNTFCIFDGIIVMSTCKCYLMEVFGPENDDVTKWLKQISKVNIDRLELIQLLPWNLGFALHLKGIGRYLLLLKDAQRTHNLMQFFENTSLPAESKLIPQSDEIISQRLSTALDSEKLEFLSILNRCVVKLENGQRLLKNCALLATDKFIHLTTENFNWLVQQDSPATVDDESELEICVRQFMMNLIEIERINELIVILNFIDDIHESSSTWTCEFETKDNANNCLIVISQSWEKLFGVPLVTEKDLLSVS